MGNSLQDQLKNIGVVNDAQAKKAKVDKRKKTKQQQKNKKATTVNESQTLVKQTAAEKLAKDKQLNQQRQLNDEKKALRAQIKQLVDENRQLNGDEDIPYNFAVNNQVKKIYVSATIRDQLARGRLAIVKLDDRYEVVPSALAEKIRSRDQSIVIVQNDVLQNAQEQNDPYADFKIPDDLMW